MGGGRHHLLGIVYERGCKKKQSSYHTDPRRPVDPHPGGLQQTEGKPGGHGLVAPDRSAGPGKRTKEEQEE